MGGWCGGLVISIPVPPGSLSSPVLMMQSDIGYWIQYI